MTLLYWNHPNTRLKSYSANTRQTSRGPETSIKIELTTRGHFDLADILRQLSQTQAEQDAAERPAPTPPAPRSVRPTARIAKTKELLALPAPLKQIPHFKD